MDDRRLGLILRALRRRLGMRQEDVARRAGVSQSVVSRAERGHLQTLSTKTVRSLFSVVDARYEGEARWRGGEVDHLLDSAHARLGAAIADELTADWTAIPEATFMRFGERGSIDLLAVRGDRRLAAVFEIKSSLTSFEQMQRGLDSKARVAASVVEERCGWRPAALGVFLVLADTSTNRGRVHAIEPLIRSALPAGTRDIRRWLAHPAGGIRGIWFLRDMAGRTVKCRHRTTHRVRRSSS